MVMKTKGATHLAKTLFGWAYAKNRSGKWFVHVNSVWKEAYSQNIEVKPIQ